MNITQEKLDQLLVKHGGQRDEIILFGIRDASNPQADLFNDFIGYATRDLIELFPGTTDPGLYWTFKRIAPPHGAAHYKEGWHPNLFQVGPHYDQDALRQVGSAPIWRDNNNNFVEDVSDPKQDGRGAGMNLHSAKDSPKIYDWSAGCQVVQKSADLRKIMAAVRSTQKYKQDPKALFSYLLVNKGEV